MWLLTIFLEETILLNGNNKKSIAILAYSLFLFPIVLSKTNAESVVFNSSNIKGKISIKSWKSLRDHQTVKQDLDYSCGAASIATVLTEYYQRPTTEKEVLELLLNVNGKKGKASFSDMEKVLPKLGFKGIGLATSWNKRCFSSVVIF